MALDVAEFLWKKFLSSLKDADSELSGSTFISYFKEIKNVLKQMDAVPESYPYCKFIPILYRLNDALAECRVFMRECKKSNKKLLIFYPRTQYSSHKMKNRLKKIKRDLKDLEAETSNHDKLPAAGKEMGECDPADMIMRARGPKLTSNVFGFQVYAEKIEGFLLGGGSNRAGFTRIGVVGIAGVGKTTLVQKVLERQSVKDEFNPIIWLPFSDNKEIEGQPTKLSFETCILDSGDSLVEMIVGPDKLLGRLNQLLSGKRYLIVLDGVLHGQVKFGERLCNGLSKGRGGALIVTTRVSEVAQKLVDQNNHLVAVEPLDREMCWSIFRDSMNEYDFAKMADDETFGKIEEEIKDQCHGLPLAAKTVAQIISKQITDNSVVQLCVMAGVLS